MDSQVRCDGEGATGMIETQLGRYRARSAAGSADMAAALALRARVFRGGAAQSDQDAFDTDCLHMLIEDVATSILVGYFRLRILASGGGVEGSYAAQFYDLSRLSALRDPVAELGRFCIAPECRDPDILRTAWAALTAMVDARGVALLFGCTSFAGLDPAPYSDSFARLQARHLAPRHLAPCVKAPEVWRFADQPVARFDANRATLQMPPLLRTYLLMGGWVSDHAVIDRDLGTLHVFTGLEVQAVPPARARLLRAAAAAGGMRTGKQPA